MKVKLPLELRGGGWGKGRKKNNLRGNGITRLVLRQKRERRQKEVKKGWGVYKELSKR